MGESCLMSSSKIDVDLYQDLMQEFKKMDAEFKDIQLTLNQKHVEVLETRKAN